MVTFSESAYSEPAMRTGTGENGEFLFEGVLSSMIYVSSINGAPIASTLEAFAKAKAPPAEYLIRRAGTEIRFRVAPE